MLTTLENHVRDPVRPIKMTERSIHSSRLPFTLILSERLSINIQNSYRYCFVESMFENENGVLQSGKVSVFDCWYDFLNVIGKIMRCRLFVI